MNKKLKYYFLLILLIASLFPNDIVAAIASLKGDVKIREDQKSKYSSAYKGQMIQSGYWIKTDNGVINKKLILQ